MSLAVMNDCGKNNYSYCSLWNLVNSNSIALKILFVNANTIHLTNRVGLFYEHLGSGCKYFSTSLPTNVARS